MFVALLLIAPAVCEWVEISQQHYRKPVRTHFHNLGQPSGNAKGVTNNNFHQHHRKPPRTQNAPFIDIVTENYEEETTVYDRKPIRTQYFPTEIVTQLSTEDGHGDTSGQYSRRPQLSATTESTEDYIGETTSEKSHHYSKPLRKHFHGIEMVNEDTENNDNREKFYLNQSLIETDVWNKGNINKVNKHGSVQRVQLHTNTVKAPNFRSNPAKSPINMKNYKDNIAWNVKYLSEIEKSTYVDESVIVDSEEKSHVLELTNNNERRKLTNNLSSNPPKNELSIDRTDFEDTTEYHRRKLVYKPKSNISLGIQGGLGFSENPTSDFITQGEILDTNIYQVNHFNINSHLPNIVSSTIIPTIGIGLIQDQPFSKMNDVLKKSTNKPNQGPNNTHIIPDFKKNAETLEEDYATVNDDDEEPSVAQSEEIVNIPEPNPTSENDQHSHTSKEPSNDSKGNSMENWLALMKVVAETIKKNTRNSVNSKTVYLIKLKDTILRNIKERIDSTWPDDPPETQVRARVSRAVQATKRGHLEIPSSESALMTISFLTFAVFLIKLVLQVIQTFKNKTMMVTPAIVATVGRAAAAAGKSGMKP